MTFACAASSRKWMIDGVMFDAMDAAVSRLDGGPTTWFSAKSAPDSQTATVPGCLKYSSISRQPSKDLSTTERHNIGRTEHGFLTYMRLVSDYLTTHRRRRRDHVTNESATLRRLSCQSLPAWRGAWEAKMAV